MPKVTKECKVCGKQYVACSTPNWGVFRWQDVACSQECATEWLRIIEESRSDTRVENKAAEE